MEWNYIRVSIVLVVSFCGASHQIRSEVETINSMRTALLSPAGLSEDERDELALNMCKANPACRIFILYPRAVGYDQQLYSVIQQYGTILHEKKIFLYNHGPFHIIKQFYFDHPWFGDYGDKKNRVAKKAEKTFRYGAKKGNPLRAFLVEVPNPDYEHFRLSKVAIRKIFKTLHVCHSDHRHKTAVRMAHAVFSNVTIGFFNKRGQDYLPEIEKSLVGFEHWLEEQNISLDNVCIVGRSCKATCGWKDTNKIDFVCSEPLGLSIILPQQYHDKSNHKKYKMIKDSLIFDHSQHFYHRGFKFAALK